MSTPSAGPDIDEPDEFAEFDEFPDGTDNFDEVVRSLAYGSRQWIRRHAGYLDSPAGRAELPLTPRVKALLQLALLCRLWAKTFPQDPALAETVAVVEHAYQGPGFPHVAELDPRYARPLLLMYCALSPPGAPAETRRTVLSRLQADGFLAVRPESPYLHLETRFFADMAGADHDLAPRAELYAASMLAHADASAVSGLDSCNITHTVLYLSEFGLRDPGLTEPQREHAARVLQPLTDHRVRCGTGTPSANSCWPSTASASIRCARTRAGRACGCSRGSGGPTGRSPANQRPNTRRRRTRPSGSSACPTRPPWSH